MMKRTKVVETTDARQASGRTTNFRVLLTSLVLIVIAGIIIYAAFYSKHQDVKEIQTQTTPGVTTAPPGTN